MTTALPATQRELMEQLVGERWIMLTMDTAVDSRTGVGEAIASELYDDLTGKLAYMLSRLAGDGFEGAVDTRDVVSRLWETITESLTAAAVAHRLGEGTETLAEAS